MSRLIAIGDIHGASRQLMEILGAIDPRPSDTIIPLGDYVDRGVDSKGVLDILIDLAKKCRMIPILGNHDAMMLSTPESESDFYGWLGIGGQVALDSYGDAATLDDIPASHFEFLRSCRDYYETETHVFTHGNYDPRLPFNEQSTDVLRWRSLRDVVPGPHCSGKVVIVGHTPQPEVLNLGYLICLDTGCGMGRELTAMEINTGQIWQSSPSELV